MAVHRPQGLLMALWLAFLRFITCCFCPPSSPAAAALPTPVTAKQQQQRPTPSPSHFLSGVRVKHPTPPLADSPAGSSTSPSLTRSASPRPSIPGHLFHPVPTPFPIISWPNLLVSPSIISEIELGRISTVTPPDVLPPPSPSLFLASHLSSTSFHTIRSPSSRPPTTPSSVLMVQLDRSSLLSPTTISDGSFQVISPGDHRGFTGSPVSISDSSRLPSPWSPVGSATSLNVWMSLDGLLTNAIGPVDDNPSLTRDTSFAPSPTLLTGPQISSVNVHSSTSALDAFGISVHVNVDNVRAVLSSTANSVETPDDPTTVSNLSQVSDQNLLAQEQHTPHRQKSVVSVTKSHASSFSARDLSSPLTKLDPVKINHIKSSGSISSVVHELQLGLFGDPRSPTPIDRIVSFLDQANPGSLPPQNDAVHPVGPADGTWG